jgi:hypothetical protein
VLHRDPHTRCRGACLIGQGCEGTLAPPPDESGAPRQLISWSSWRHLVQAVTPGMPAKPLHVFLPGT